MKSLALVVILIVPIVCGCNDGQSDLVGAWGNDSLGEIVFAKNGKVHGYIVESFLKGLPVMNEKVSISGTWDLKGGSVFSDCRISMTIDSIRKSPWIYRIDDLYCEYDNGLFSVYAYLQEDDGKKLRFHKR